MYNAHCIIQGCKTTIYNKQAGVNFFPLPTSNEMRNRWLHVLRNKCSIIDWSKCRICSRHFELRCFDSQRKLRENAIPTLFPPKPIDISRPKIDRVLNKMTQAELVSSIKDDFNALEEPQNLDEFVNENLKCISDAPEEAQLWVLLKKQEHLNNRLTEALGQTRKHAEKLQRNVESFKSNKVEKEKGEKEQSIDSYKYIIKCLQEKLATYEEQIEILTAVEST